MPKARFSQRKFLTAIKGSGGIINTIAKKMGCTWRVARDHILADPVLMAAFQDESEIMLDMAETTLLSSIRDGDTGDAKWLLSRKGKGRGYTERNESLVLDWNALDLSAVPFEVWQRMANGEKVDMTPYIKKTE
jgi:hypothetical protein